MKIWRFHFIKLCFVWAGVVSFELACSGLNWLPCVSLSPTAKYMVLIGLRFWNQALLHLPSTFANEFLSELNCKVNLIHANMSSIISCSTKRSFRATLLCSSHAFPTFSLHSLVPFLFLHKLIGPFMQEVNPHLKRNPPSHSPAPHSSPTPDCVYCSALSALSCCVFYSCHLSLVPASQQWDLCIIYATATGKWRWGWTMRRPILGYVMETQNSNASN